MIQIKPVSDLRNEMYSRLTDGAEMALDEAGQATEVNNRRMDHEEVFGNLRRKMNAL